MKKNTVRTIIQAGFGLFYCWVGYRFYQYVQWAMGESVVYVERPVAVEAFLPIGALISLKRFLLTGLYDSVHPAALTIFLLALFLAVFLRKSFCGYLCPVGGALSAIERIGEATGTTRRPPRWLSYLLYVPKYLLLGVILFILAQMGSREIEAFITTQYWRVSDSRMLLFFLNPTVLTLVVLGVIIVGNLLIKGFWCQGLCPYGALLGILSWFSPVFVQRDKKSCISCGKCAKACPSRIAVDKKELVIATACVGCGECVVSCPVDNCLSFSVGYGKKRWPVGLWFVPLATLVVVLLAWVFAVNAGLWYTPIDVEQIRQDHTVIHMLSHY